MSFRDVYKAPVFGLTGTSFLQVQLPLFLTKRIMVTYPCLLWSSSVAFLHFHPHCELLLEFSLFTCLLFHTFSLQPPQSLLWPTARAHIPSGHAFGGTHWERFWLRFACGLRGPLWPGWSLPRSHCASCALRLTPSVAAASAFLPPLLLLLLVLPLQHVRPTLKPLQMLFLPVSSSLCSGLLFWFLHPHCDHAWSLHPQGTPH